MYKTKTNLNFVSFYMFSTSLFSLFKYSIYISFLLFLSSCSSSDSKNNIRGNGNNLRAYYNTFYMAEKSYNDALELIQATSNDNKQNITQIENLLDIAINNSLIIENKFYNTKYIDDAIYILGMSSYFKNRITAASYYFKKILNDYPNSKNYNKVNIQLGLLDLKIGKINEFQKRLEDVSLKDLNQEEKYEYYNLMAYFYEIYDDTFNKKINYSNALKHARTIVKKIYIYNKLLEIS